MIHDVQLITVQEFQDQWPKGPEGEHCARLLRRYVLSVLINSAEGASCSLERGAAESGANAAFASLFQHVKDLGRPSAPEPERTSPLQPLNRFRDNPKP